MTRSRSLALMTAAVAVLLMHVQPTAQGGQQDQQPATNEQQSFRFKTGVELINVTATVSNPMPPRCMPVRRPSIAR